MMIESPFPPLIQVFNKVDVARHDFALGWMADFDAYSTALEVKRSATRCWDAGMLCEGMRDAHRMGEDSALSPAAHNPRP
jgi:hypothetical protein